MKLLVRVLDHGRNNEGSMLLYNLAAMKNSKMKMFTEDKSREKQRSPAKTTLIASELALKGSLSEHWNLNKVSVKPWQGFCGFSKEPQASLISKKVRAECAQLITLSSNHFGKTTAIILPQQGRHCFGKEPPPTLLCKSNQRCLIYQQWISVAVICLMRTVMISSNVKQFSIRTKH